MGGAVPGRSGSIEAGWLIDCRRSSSRVSICEDKCISSAFELRGGSKKNAPALTSAFNSVSLISPFPCSGCPPFAIRPSRALSVSAHFCSLSRLPSRSRLSSSCTSEYVRLPLLARPRARVGDAAEGGIQWSTSERCWYEASG